MLQRVVRRFLLVLACFAPAVSAVEAQTSSATLQGTISDTSGGVLPGVTIKLQAPATGLERETVSNETGLYVFNFLPAGRYEVTAELTGFKSVKHDDVRLEIGQSLSLDLKLEVGRVEETVIVEGIAPLLDRTSASIGTVIQSSQLRELPLAGRHWAGLMLLAPGAINTGDGTHLSTRFAGRARDDNNWTFDGIDATGVKDPRQDSAARLIISSESIAEFRVGSTLYSAESGAGAGGQVQLISKTGTNQFRGSVYDFVRNDMFDARPFGTIGEMQPFRLNQYGANLGGPIVPQRTFFFVNFEGIRQHQTQSFTRFVPSQAFRASVPAALAGVMAAYPSGTRGTADPNIDEWNVAQKFIAEEDAPSFRVDHRLSNNATLFARYNFDNADIINPTDTGFTTNQLRPKNFTVQFQQILTSTIVNEVKFGYNASLRTSLRTGPSDVQISMSGLFTTLTGPQEIIEDGRTFSVIDNLGIVRGRHNVKMGGEIRRIYVDVGEGSTTSLSYTSREDVQANRLESFGIVDFPVVQGQRWWYFGYVQDDIKLRPNLTINAGFRYEYYSVVKEKDGRDRVWRVSCGGFCPPGTPWYDADKNNVAPRLGFAWSPARFNDRTVIRGGYGIFFGPGQNDDVFAPIDNAGNRIALERASVPSLSYPIEPFLQLAATSGNAPRAVDEHRVDQYAEHYSLSIQQALPWRFISQIGYIGNQGHHMLDRSYVNLLDPVTRRRPLPAFGRVDIKSSGSSTNFNGLQLSLQRPMTAGFLVGAQYMWSHAFDEGSLGGGESSAPQNVACRSCEYASTNQDIRHTLTVNWIYELPFGEGRRFADSGALRHVLGGWMFSGLMQARTGRPLTISVNRSAGAMPDGNNSGQRPNAVPGVSPIPATQTPERWLDIAAFAVPQPGTWGDLGRNTLRGPGLIQIDFALQRRFQIGADRNFEFRWEAFNAFNRQNLANPGTNISNSVQFGRITGPLNLGYGTGTARQMQFMARFNF